MQIKKFPVLALLAFLYFAPGLFFFRLPAEADADVDLDSTAVLASPDEPGEPLRVSGTVYGPDGETPAAGAVLFVYHTDAEGYYTPGTNDNRNPRLQATLRTGADGRYEFRTIKPAPYPGGGVPAHIHYVVEGADFPEQRHDLHFEGDPYLTRRATLRSAEAGRFGSVRPFAPDAEGVLQVTFDLRLRE